MTKYNLFLWKNVYILFRNKNFLKEWNMNTTDMNNLRQFYSVVNRKYLNRDVSRETLTKE